MSYPWLKDIEGDSAEQAAVMFVLGWRDGHVGHMLAWAQPFWAATAREPERELRSLVTGLSISNLVSYSRVPIDFNKAVIADVDVLVTVSRERARTIRVRCVRELPPIYADGIIRRFFDRLRLRSPALIPQPSERGKRGVNPVSARRIR